VRRFAVIPLLVLLAGVCLFAQPARSATLYDSDGITLLSSSMWGPDTLGIKHVVGEIRNDTGASITGFQWLLEYKDAAGKVISGYHNSWGAWWVRLAPGERAPIFSTAPKEAVTHRVVAMSGETTAVPVNRNFSVTLGAPKPGYDPNYVYMSGTITNLNDQAAEDVHVIVTIYGGGGIRDTVDEWVGWDTSRKTLASGETRTFSIQRHASDPTGSFSYFADSKSAPGNRIPPPMTTTSSTTTTTRPTTTTPATGGSGPVASESSATAPFDDQWPGTTTSSAPGLTGSAKAAPKGGAGTAPATTAPSTGTTSTIDGDPTATSTSLDLGNSSRDALAQPVSRKADPDGGGSPGLVVLLVVTIAVTSGAAGVVGQLWRSRRSQANASGG
jgi:hypothetical protein